MYKLTICLLMALSSALIMPAYAEEQDTSPIGLWKTIDDVTGKPKAIIEIKENQNKSLEGRILKIFSESGEIKNKVCKACEGEKHNQPLIGMVVLEDLKKNKEASNQWTDGKILDPKNGKIYHCYVQAINQGQKLNVRGFIGVPIFGRTQTWVKVQQIV